MPDLRRKALRNASRLQLKEKIRNFIKSSSYYTSEEDERIIKWNKDQLNTRTREQSLKRENEANLPYAVLSAPAHYEGKFFGIIYKPCGHEFIVTSNELEYRKAMGCKICKK